jgi:hypothetical protein
MRLPCVDVHPAFAMYSQSFESSAGSFLFPSGPFSPFLTTMT